MNKFILVGSFFIALGLGSFFSTIFSGGEPDITFKIGDRYVSPIYYQSLSILFMGAICEDETYQPISRAWVEWFYSKEFRPYLNKITPNWQERFDCNRFCALFAAQAQVKYLPATWHKYNMGKAAAIGTFSYTRDDGKGVHEVISVYTENGKEFFEPQTGKWVTLSLNEENRKVFARF